MRKLLLVFVAAVVLHVAPPAYAFREFGHWINAAEAATPGAGTLLATGGARDFGVTCALCHTKGVGLIDTTITPSPAFLLKAGSSAYAPNTAYTITIKLVGENKGLTPKAGTVNYNSFMLTVENQNGQPVGSYSNDQTPKVTTANCASPPAPTIIGTTLLVGAAGMPCYSVMARPLGNLTSWTFTWTAPAAGSGPLTLYYGMVDGDANTSSLGDDVKVGTVKLVEGP